MNHRPFAGGAAALVAIFLAAGPACRKAPAPAPPSAWARPLRSVVFERTAARRERGRYLAEGILQCFNCHSDRDSSKPGAPPVEGKKGAGHVWYDEPTRRLVSPNLTPDPETGAGTWTDDMFARAIREGVGHDGRPLHPQMWYASFRSLSDEDVASVVVYLRTIPPVKNRLPPTRLAPGRREGIQKNLHPLTEPVPAPDMSTPLLRGRYLARVADCEGCHTAWEAPMIPGRFGGGNFIEIVADKKLTAISRNLTPDPSGIPYYDDALFIEAIRTGRVRTRDLSPIMPWIVFRNLTDDDLRALHAYLKSLLPVRHLVDTAEPEGLCPACGQKHGAGLVNHPQESRAIPVDPRALAGSEGRYVFRDFSWTISREGGKYFAEDGTGKKEILTEDNRLFFTKSGVDVLELVRAPGGQVTGMIDRAFDDERTVKSK